MLLMQYIIKSKLVVLLILLGSNPANCKNIACNPDKECTIICEDIDAENGCSNIIINAKNASSLNVTCSSQDLNAGGCQFSTIYCPFSNNSQCNIQCKDYYSCYLTKIYSSYPNTTIDSIHNQTVNINCMDESGSCLKTILYANTSSNVNISCYGSGILESDAHSSCDNLQIFIQNITDNFNLLCSDDYSCYELYLYGNKANYINIYARGNLALSSSYIYAQNANKLDIFCGSEESEYGCSKLNIFNPTYKSLGSSRTNIKCQGHGCYEDLRFFSQHGALDLDISLNGCGECYDAGSCINNWFIYCDVLTYDEFYGDSCDSEHCDCGYAKNTIKSHSKNDLSECDIFTFDFECEAGTECIIDCMDKWPNDNGCYDKVINGQNTASLTVICNSTSNNPIYGACESSHIYCPSLDKSECNILCENKDACYDTEISMVNNHQSSLNLTCINTDSCSHTNVYGIHNDDISINCIATDSCDNMNVTANYADNVTIHCEGDASTTSYSACNQFNIWATNTTNTVKLICRGDHSCYNVDIHANHSKNVVIDTIGNYAGYYGFIHAKNAENMLISCKGEYGTYGCYNMHFYIPEKATSIQCEGHGCRYLYLYAPNGFTDIINVDINGCGECSNVDNCIDDWYMYCGTDYTSRYTWYGYSCWSSTCDCNDAGFQKLYTNGWSNDNIEQCDLFTPDTSCPDGTPCVVDCSSNNECSSHLIVGNNASSLTINCGYYGCNAAKIYCPHSYHSECNIICNGYYSCRQTKIYGAENSLFNLSCISDQACYDADIYIDDTYQSDINCIAKQACYSMAIVGDNAKHINLNCIGNYSSYSYASCAYSLNARNSKSVILNCIGDYSCHPNSFYTNNAENVVINAIGSRSIYSSTINAQNASNLSLNLESYRGDTDGVYSTSFYVAPDGKTNLNCIGYGCSNINLYSKNGMKDIKNISFNGCNYCISLDQCIEAWNLHCGSSYYTSTTLSGSHCKESNCDCKELTAQLQDAWIYSTADKKCNLTIAADFSCPAGSPCTIDCSSKYCQNKVIWGHKASSLTVYCGYSNCNYINIYCPETADSLCNINCDASSCYYSEIYADKDTILNVEAKATNSFAYGNIYAANTKEVTVNCSYQKSCRYANIYASEAQNVNIYCSGYASSTSYGSCYNTKIYVSLVSGQVNLICSNRCSCYYTYLNADNANNVTVFGDNARNSMSDAKIDAHNASHFDLTCIGSTDYYGCYKANIYVPEKQKTTIRCYGYGCYYLYLYVSDGMTSLSASNIILNSCNLCSSPSDCITRWQIYCDYVSQYDHVTYFSGSICTSSSYNCGCSSHTNLLTNVFVNRPRSNGCHTIAKTPFPTIEPSEHPTASPTTQYPTSSPTAHPTPSPTTHPTSSPTTDPTQYPTPSPTNSMIPTQHPTYLITTLYSTYNKLTSSPTFTSTSTTSLAKSNVDDGNMNEITIFIIAGIVLFCLVIGNIIYCKYRSNKNIPHERLQEEEEGNDIAAPQIELKSVSMAYDNINDNDNDENMDDPNRQNYVKLQNPVIESEGIVPGTNSNSVVTAFVVS